MVELGLTGIKVESTKYGAKYSKVTDSGQYIYFFDRRGIDIKEIIKRIQEKEMEVKTWNGK